MTGVQTCALPISHQPGARQVPLPDAAAVVEARDAPDARGRGAKGRGGQVQEQGAGHRGCGPGESDVI